VGPSDADAPRRTYLAAERTWLAWWRTGLAATVAGFGVGRLLPEVVGGTTWPYVVVGAGYVTVALALMIAAGVRQGRVRAALRRGSFEELDDRWIGALTGAGAVLTAATLAIVVIGP
jgi:putative membrane protein